MKGHERILELHSLLSKLMDSLCFELTVNRIDENCLSLIEYISTNIGSYNGKSRVILTTKNSWNCTKVGYNPNQSLISSPANKLNAIRKSS